MTRKRYIAVVGFFVLLIGSGVAVTLMMPPSPGVTKSNFDRVQLGMTLAETAAIFGRPANGTVKHADDEAFVGYQWGGADGWAFIQFKDYRVDEVTGKRWDDSGDNSFTRWRRYFQRKVSSVPPARW